MNTKTENRQATIGVVCNNASNFVNLQNAFKQREDLTGYKLVWIGDNKRATRYANIVDFAILYIRKGEKGMNDEAARAYKVLDKCDVKIRLAFFQIVNYVEN